MKSILTILFTYIFCTIPTTAKAQYQLQNGDLIFQEACPDKPDDTIKEVTSSAGNYNFTHVGIVYIDEKDSIFVIEATIPIVKITPVKEYLYPPSETGCFPISVAARLKQEYQHLIPGAIQEAKKQIGKEYDYAFNLLNDAYYCSELIYEAFVQANKGVEIFPLNKMTFKSPQTGEFTKGWIDWFEKLGIPIPEGEPGINPGAMSQAEVIEFLFTPLSYFYSDIPEASYQTDS